MSNYTGVAALRENMPFQKRVDAAAFFKANIYKDDQREPFILLAEMVLKSGTPATLFNYVCNAPGFGDKTNPVDDISDGDIESALDYAWPIVAELLFPPEEAPQ